MLIQKNYWIKVWTVCRPGWQLVRYIWSISTAIRRASFGKRTGYFSLDGNSACRRHSPTLSRFFWSKNGVSLLSFVKHVPWFCNCLISSAMNTFCDQWTRTHRTSSVSSVLVESFSSNMAFFLMLLSTRSQ